MLHFCSFILSLMPLTFSMIKTIFKRLCCPQLFIKNASWFHLSKIFVTVQKQYVQNWSLISYLALQHCINFYLQILTTHLFLKCCFPHLACKNRKLLSSLFSKLWRCVPANKPRASITNHRAERAAEAFKRVKIKNNVVVAHLKSHLSLALVMGFPSCLS